MKLVVLDANAFWTEQLFRQCARFADVLLLKPRDFRAHRTLSGTLRSDRSPRSIADRVSEQRVSLPPGWMVGLWPWTQRRLAGVIRAFAGRDPLTLVITYPQYRGLISALRPDLSIYYNLDDYRDNWPRHARHVPEWEAKTVAASDVTICIADYRAKLLRLEHPEKSDRIHHLPLGVTPEFMSGRRAELHRSSLTPKPARIAGYIGALNYRFDFAFLADVATRMPEVTFLLGGRVQEDGDAAWRTGLARAQATANIEFLGWVDHAQLGMKLADFDVLLMPYAHCNFNTNACPAKLWDYLGTGKPIVANEANPETLLWREVVRVGGTPEAFVAQIRDALGEQGSDLRERRLAVAREHTWEKLSERLEQILTLAK